MVAVPYRPPTPGDDLGPLIRAARSVQASTALANHVLHESLSTDVGGPDVARIDWVHIDETVDSASDTGYVAPIDPDSLAFILLTSGSTSAPKGVMRSHRSQLDGLLLTLAAQGISSDSHVVNWDAPHAGPAISNPMRALVGGVPATLLQTQSVLEKPVRWLRAISRVRGTHTNATNFALDLCARSVSEQEKAELDLRSLICVGCGGEMVHADTLDRFLSAFAPCGVRKEALSPRYAATEAGAISTVRVGRSYSARHFDRAALEEGRVAVAGGGDSGTNPTTRLLVGCGPPVQGLDVRIVDPGSLTQCDPGRVGEVWVAGPGVALGYWQQPEETERVFHARLADTGEGPFCRTGDLGFISDGELFIAGRLKEMIIIRGRNVFSVDLELTLQGCHPALHDMTGAAFAVEDADAERLAVVQEVSEDLDRDEIDRLVVSIRHAVVGGHGIQPHRVVLVPPGEVPRVGMGKVGRAECRSRLLSGALRVISEHTLDRDSIRVRTGYRAPQSDTERTLVRIWEAMIGTSPIGVDDAWADLGGDSLLRIQIVMAMTEAGLTVSSHDLQRDTTIAELSRAVGRRQAREEQRVGPLTSSVRLTPNQVAMLRSGESTIPWARGAHVLRAGERVDPRLLARAMQHLQFHHDALRLRCRRTESGWRGEFAAHTPLTTLSAVDLSPYGPAEQKHRVGEEIARLRASLDVERGPMVNAGLIRLGPGHDLVLVAAHHIVTDYMSSWILLRDLDSLYRQLRDGRPPRLPAKSSTLREWVSAVSAYGKSAAVQSEAEYWMEIGSHPPSALPGDPPRLGCLEGVEQAVEARLEGASGVDLQALGRLGLSITDVFHYAISRALSTMRGTDTVRFETLSHGRSPILPRIDLSRTVGFFITEFPVRLRLEPDTSHLDGLRAIRTQLEAIPHHGMGYHIAKHYGERETRQRLKGLALSRVRLNCVGRDTHRYAGLNLFRTAEEWRPAPSDSGQEPATIPWHDRLEVTASASEEGLRLSVDFHPCAYRSATIDAFTGSMLQVIRELAQSVRSEVSGHSVYAQGERGPTTTEFKLSREVKQWQ
jgi:non-ribosomal peptide synthase protein (TIGR01720 family)